MSISGSGANVSTSLRIRIAAKRQTRAVRSSCVRRCSENTSSKVRIGCGFVSPRFPGMGVLSLLMGAGLEVAVSNLGAWDAQATPHFDDGVAIVERHDRVATFGA